MAATAATSAGLRSRCQCAGSGRAPAAHCRRGAAHRIGLTTHCLSGERQEKFASSAPPRHAAGGVRRCACRHVNALGLCVHERRLCCPKRKRRAASPLAVLRACGASALVTWRSRSSTGHTWGATSACAYGMPGRAACCAAMRPCCRATHVGTREKLASPFAHQGCPSRLSLSTRAF